MDISIIIVSWNAKEYIIKCLNSIIKNIKKVKYEIIVVDNGSTDGTVEYLQKNFKSIDLIINNENFGFSKANNIGILKSKGKFLYLINSDIEILDDSINKIFDFMEKNPNIGMLGPKILNFDLTLQYSCRRIPTLWNLFCVSISLNNILPDTIITPDIFMRKWHYNKIENVGILSGCFWALRRDAIKDVGLLDEMFFIYGEDMDWSKRFNDSKWDVLYFPEAKVIHYGGASSSNAPIRFYLEMQKANLQYWQKHHGKISTFIYNVIVMMHHSIRFVVYSFISIILIFRSKEMKFKIKRHFYTILWNLKLYKLIN